MIEASEDEKWDCQHGAVSTYHFAHTHKTVFPHFKSEGTISRIGRAATIFIANDDTKNLFDCKFKCRFFLRSCRGHHPCLGDAAIITKGAQSERANSSNRGLTARIKPSPPLWLRPVLSSHNLSYGLSAVPITQVSHAGLRCPIAFVPLPISVCVLDLEASL